MTLDKNKTFVTLDTLVGFFTTGGQIETIFWGQEKSLSRS